MTDVEVLKDGITLLSKEWKDQNLKISSVVYAPYPGKDPVNESFYWGKITNVHEPVKTFDIEFSDGDVVTGLSSEHIHPHEEALQLMKSGKIDKVCPPTGYLEAADETSDNATSPRRSGRQRTSTTITIQGHTVLRKNNYQVKGDVYEWGNDENQERPAKKQKKAAAKPATTTPTTTPRQPSAVQVARSAHNQEISKRIASRASLRQAFLAKHVDLLETFCEPHVLAKLKAAKPQEFSNVPVTVQPKAIQATLRDYQLKGLDFMVRMYRQNLPCILGDEMGLGKTLQTISLLTWLKQEEGVTGPSLVICPLSVLSSWSNELERWAPTLKVFMYHANGPKQQNALKTKLAQSNPSEYDVILTTYEQAKLPVLKSTFQRLHFHYLVLDEGHKIKGHETQIAQAVHKIHRGSTLLLTGTPLQNNLVELWSLLHFMYPDVFTTLRPFEEAFNLNDNVIDKDFLKKSQKLLDLFMLRRLKTEVEKLMPKKLETKVYCPLSKVQTFWYKSLLLKDLSALERCEHDGDVDKNRYQVLKNLFMQLRKCCNHPFSIHKDIEPDSTQTSLTDLVACSGKLSVLDMLLQSLCQKGHRSVLFSQFTMVLDIIEDYCLLRGWKYCRLDGGVARARRNYDIRRFNETNSPYFLFLVSTRSGGMGLNLQSADTAILFDSDWNPQSDIQAMGRVHRIGQTKTVHVYRLISAGTVEERMIERAEKKLLLEVVNRENKGTDEMVDDTVRDLSAAELFKDIKFGSQAVFGNATNELPTWQDICNITNRERLENESVGKVTGGTQLSADTFQADKEFSATLNFHGTDFRQIRAKMAREQKKAIPKNLDGIAHLWKEISTLSQKRKRKSRLVQVDSKNSGWGSATVPVLASNNYELEHGESSVFDRELKNKKRSKAVRREKKAKTFEHQDICQVCGDGGLLVLCPRCPVAVHLQCCGLTQSKHFDSCSHHRCTSCGKNGTDAGGLLYPCHACPRSFCEECLPSGVTFLENVDRFDELGFDSTKKTTVYINCSLECEVYAKKYLHYTPPPPIEKQTCPKRLRLDFNFGSSIDVDKEMEEVAEQKKAELDKLGRGFRRAAATTSMSKSKTLASNEDSPDEKLSRQIALEGSPIDSSFSESQIDSSSSEELFPPEKPLYKKNLIPQVVTAPSLTHHSHPTVPKQREPEGLRTIAYSSSSSNGSRPVPVNPIQKKMLTPQAGTVSNHDPGLTHVKPTVKSLASSNWSQGQGSGLVMTLWCPPGKLGVGIAADKDGRCRVATIVSPNTFLMVGDILTSVNGLELSFRNKHIWIKMISSFENAGYTLTIIRQTVIDMPISQASSAFGAPTKSKFLSNPTTRNPFQAITMSVDNTRKA